MLIAIPVFAVSAGLCIIALTSLIIPPCISDDSLEFSRKLIESGSIPLVLLGAVLYGAQRIDIWLFTSCMNALRLVKTFMPFMIIWLLYKLLTL